MNFTKKCIVYADNELLYTDLRTRAEHAWGCLTECFKGVKGRVTGGLLENSTELTEEDVMQDVLMKFYVKLVYDGYYEPFERRSLHFCNFIRTQYINRCKDIYRARQRRPGKAPEGEAEILRDNSENPEESVIFKEELDVFNKLMMSKLSSQERTAYRLIVIEGNSIAETADLMQITSRTVSNYVCRALRILKETHK